MDPADFPNEGNELKFREEVAVTELFYSFVTLDM